MSRGEPRSGSTPRADVARYYDLAPHHPDDVPFYVRRLRAPASTVLELGCGTGRVSIPLARACARLRGIDHSDEMLRIARDKAETAGLGPERLTLEVGDITRFDLGERFDLIIAPFRVIQNLETDDQLDAVFEGVRDHLTPGGRCILNAFHPNRPRAELAEAWAAVPERTAWEVEYGDGVVTCTDRHVRVQTDPLVLHPELVYRYTVAGSVRDEATLPIAMRCYYPDEFIDRIESAGFRVTGRWGGYAGEEYGRGGELVVEFENDG